LGNSAKMRSGSVHSTEYRSMYSAHTIAASKYKASWVSTTRLAKMTAPARSILEDSPAQEVFDQLGFFYCMDLTLGGLFSAEFVTEASEADTSRAVAASVKTSFSKWVPKVEGGARLGRSTETRKSARRLKESSQILALGGNPEICLKLMGPEDVDKIQTEWAEFVDDSNLMMLPGSFAPAACQFVTL